MDVTQYHVVVIGGGFGGLSAVRSLAAMPGRITLIDKRNFHLFQPLLYQAATGLLCPSEITAPLRHVLRKQKNTTVLLGEVVDFDPANKRIILADGETGYDVLIVAPGMVNYYYGHDEWTRYAPGLKTIEDTSAIRQKIFYAFEVAERETDPVQKKEWLTFAVIGSGATGIELTGMLAEIAHNTLQDEFRSIRPDQADILLLDAAARILPSFSADLAEKAQQTLIGRGVTIRTGARVIGIDKKGITVESPEGSEFIPARTVLWTTGVTASPLGKKLAEKTYVRTDTQGRIMVNPDLTIPGHKDIYVIGDMAHCPGKHGIPLPGVAPVATQQGRFVAREIMNRLSGRPFKKSFSYFNKGSLAVIGRNAAIADIGRLHFGGHTAWFLWLFVHLFLLIKFENRIIVFIRWAFQYFSYSSSARQLGSTTGTLRLPLSRSRHT